MAVQALEVPKFKPPKEVIADWSTFRRGLNIFSRENEIRSDEAVLMTNVMLVGGGNPTKRWGSADYFTAGPTGYGRFLLPVKANDGEIQVLAMTDSGLLTKKNGTSYTIITGASFPSGYDLSGVQLGNNVYLTSEITPLVRYDFNTLTSFATLLPPTNLAVSNVSGATGVTQFSWRVTAVSQSGGETIASPAVSLATLPQNLTNTMVRLAWTPTSAASGDLVGYNIYRGAPGDEVWIGGVDNLTNVFFDFGTATTDPTRTVPLANTTGGPKAKYSLRFQDRLVLAGIPGEPTKVVISGRYPQHERFDWYSGGGFILIEPDSGEEITGLATYYQASTQTQTIIVFKERSVWELKLGYVTVGSYVILDPQYRLLTASQGCSSNESIVSMENDIGFSNNEGMYILRYEPQLLNVINANELSAKVRPFFESLSTEDKSRAAGGYQNKKWVLSFPISKKTIVFDRERLSFTGPWPTPFGVARWEKYVDGAGTERWLALDADDNKVSEFSASYSSDKGSAIATIFKTKKENFGDWTIFKTINEVYTNFRAVVGTVQINIYIEDRTGRTITAKSFTVTTGTAVSTSGIGIDQLGTVLLGTTSGVPETSNDEQPRRAFIYKSSRYFQIEVRTDGLTDNYELLGVKAVAIPQSRGNSPSAWNV